MKILMKKNRKFALSVDPPANFSRIEHDLVERARRSSNKHALIAESKHLTYADLFTYAAHLLSELIRCGITRGERVTVYLDKTPEAVVACYAIWLAGGILVPAHEGLHAVAYPVVPGSSIFSVSAVSNT